MKTKLYSILKFAICVWSFLWLNGSAYAQICQNEKDTLYGLSTTGVIYPININDGGVGTPLDSLTTGVAPVNTNGIGFVKATGTFYYFERAGTTVAPSVVFMSYAYPTRTTAQLATPGITGPTTNKIRSGCMNNGGTGYYMIEPTNTATNAALWYYNVSLDTWTIVANNFTDPVGTSLNANFHNLNSGDMAFDGLGNLWIVCSSTTNYALYKISAPVPTTGPAGTIKATQIIGTTPTPTSGKSFTGVAFNSAGIMYLTTGSGDNKIYKLISTSSSITYVATMNRDDVGADLTTCSIPFGVLSSTWQEFKGVVQKHAALTWTITEDPDCLGYEVERSKDAEHWEGVAFIDRKGAGEIGRTQKYYYTDAQFPGNIQHYRIARIWRSGARAYSITITLRATAISSIQMGPNPAANILYLNNLTSSKYLAQIFDHNGTLVLTTGLAQANSIAIGHLKKGAYVLKLISAEDQSQSAYPFVKL